jgi:hypothetical protein
MDFVDRIHGFMRDTVASAFAEVAAAPRLQREFQVDVVDGEESGVDIIHPMIGHMIAVLREGTADDSSQIYGQTLVIEERDESKKQPHYAGRFLISPLFRIAGEEVFASPTVLFQMKFDGKLHKFMHRYDNAVENHRIEEVTRPQILNHVLNSFTFYRLHAFSDKRPW